MSASNERDHGASESGPDEPRPERSARLRGADREIECGVADLKILCERRMGAIDETAHFDESFMGGAGACELIHDRTYTVDLRGDVSRAPTHWSTAS